MKSKKSVNCDIVVLYKDHHYDSIPSNEFIYSKDMKYVLIPISDIDGHIMIKANKYMIFDKAKISYSLQPRHVEWEDDKMEVTPLETVNVECTDIVKLYNYIHTMTKLSYCDYVLHKTFKEDDVVFDMGFFNIKLYKNEEVIFHFEYGIEMNEECYVASADDSKACEEIQKLLKPIYSSPKTIYETTGKLIIFKDNRWKFIKRTNAGLYEKVLCGVPMLYTSTMYFCPIEEFLLYDDNISNFYNRLVLVEPSVLEDLSEDEKWEAVSEGDYDYYDSYDYRCGDALLVIEYLIYIQFILKVLKFLWNMYYSYQLDSKLPSFEIYGQMDFRCFGKRDVSYMYHDSRTLSIDRLVEDLIRLQKGEILNECSII